MSRSSAIRSSGSSRPNDGRGSQGRRQFSPGTVGGGDAGDERPRLPESQRHRNDTGRSRPCGWPHRGRDTVHRGPDERQRHGDRRRRAPLGQRRSHPSWDHDLRGGEHGRARVCGGDRAGRFVRDGRGRAPGGRGRNSYDRRPVRIRAVCGRRPVRLWDRSAQGVPS